MPEPQFNPDAELGRLMMAPQAGGGAPAFNPDAELARLQMQPRRLTPMPTATGGSLTLRNLDNIGRMVANGMSFGFADELAAAGRAGVGAIGDMFTTPAEGDAGPRGFSARYDAALTDERARDAQIRQDMPVAAPVAELAGGVASGIGAARGLPGVFGAARTGGLPWRMWEGSRAGTVGGALGGFGNSEGGFDQRAQGALQGGAIGGLVGAAVPPVAAAVGGTVARVAGPVGNILGVRDAERAGLNQLLRAFQRDGVNIEDATTRYNQWVREGARPETLVDLGGENVRAYAQRLVNVPGASRQAGRDAVEARTMGQGDRVATDLQQATGQQGGQFYPTLDALDTARRTTAAPLYDAAYARDIPATTDLMETVRRIVGMSPNVVRDANRLAAGEGFNGPATTDGGLSTRFLDYVKRHLDDAIQADRAANNGRLSNVGRIANEQRVSLLSAMDTANPDYAAARAAWAGPSRLAEVMDQGRSIFQSDSEITSAVVRGLSPSEREAFRLGVARAIQDRIANTSDGRNVVASFFRSPGLRARVEAAFDSPSDFMRFQAAMNREMQMAQNNQFMNPRGNSITSRMAAEGDDQAIDVPSSAIMQLLTGHPIQAARTGGIAALNRVQGMNSATSDAMAPYLFATTPAGNQQALGVLQAMQARRNFDRLQRQNRLFGIIGGGAAVGAPPNRE